jgi:hypothetical protein
MHADHISQAVPREIEMLHLCGAAPLAALMALDRLAQLQAKAGASCPAAAAGAIREA